MSRGQGIGWCVLFSFDRRISILYTSFTMLMVGRYPHCFSPAILTAAVLAVVLPVCLIAGTMASQDSCQDLGSPPGLCGKTTSDVTHLVAVPAPLILLDSPQQISMPLTISLEPIFPSVGHFSIPDGRAPPLA